MSSRPIAVAPSAAFGLVLGALLGILAGLAEAAALPGAHASRIPFVLGVDGLLGAMWGWIASGTAALLPPRSGAGAGRAAAVTLFPFLAMALGLAINRVALSGVHFLHPLSLAADAVALAAAFFLARAAGALLGRRLPRGLPAAARAAAFGLPALLAAAAWFAVRAPDRGAPDPALPSIVLVSLDTLRADHLSAAGDPRGTTPHLDRLCREGTHFAQAVAVSPGSAASHAALLTSRYPVSSGVWANFSVMDPAVVTWAEILRDRGYRTGGFATNTFLGARFHFDQGFASYVESGVVERLEESSPAVLLRSLAVVQVLDRLRSRFVPGFEASFETGLAWFRETDRPTFLFLHLMDVHSPYVPPFPYDLRYGAHPDGTDESPRHRNRFGWRPSEEAYAAEVRWADAKIGRLRRRLEELGRLDDSVLILTSDHGENLLDHEPNFSHGRTLYDSTLRILAAVRYPHGAPRGRLESTPAENVDLLPTVADWMDVAPHPDWEGRSLAPGGDPGHWTVAQLNRDFAVRWPDRKVVLRETGEREILDLVRDPGEQRPAYDGPAVAEAEAVFAEWFARRSTPLYREQARAVRPEELSPETVEKLRALGYLE